MFETWTWYYLLVKQKQHYNNHCKKMWRKQWPKVDTNGQNHHVFLFYCRWSQSLMTYTNQVDTKWLALAKHGQRLLVSTWLLCNLAQTFEKCDLYIQIEWTWFNNSTKQRIYLLHYISSKATFTTQSWLKLTLSSHVSSKHLDMLFKVRAFFRVPPKNRVHHWQIVAKISLSHPFPIVEKTFFLDAPLINSLDSIFLNYILRKKMCL